MIACFFFIFKSTWHDSDFGTDSGLSDSWRSEGSATSAESAPLLSVANYRAYTEDKVQYYEDSRKRDNEVSKDFFMFIIIFINTIKIVFDF